MISPEHHNSFWLFVLSWIFGASLHVDMDVVILFYFCRSWIPASSAAVAVSFFYDSSRFVEKSSFYKSNRMSVTVCLSVFFISTSLLVGSNLIIHPWFTTTTLLKEITLPPLFTIKNYYNTSTKIIFALMCIYKSIYLIYL